MKHGVTERFKVGKNLTLAVTVWKDDTADVEITHDSGSPLVQFTIDPLSGLSTFLKEMESYDWPRQ